MIAKICPLIIAVILLTAGLILWRYGRRWKWYGRMLTGLVAFACVGCTILISLEKDYFPDDIRHLFLYMDLLFLLIVPAAMFAVCSAFGTRRGRRIGILLAVVVAATYAYGTFIGANELRVRHIEISFSDLPEAFDGYKIVQFSDTHVGSLIDGRESYLQQAVDSINAQQPDLVVFTGDMQNKQPSEIVPHIPTLSAIQAHDGICSVLGNHDYAKYIDDTDPISVGRNLGQTRGLQQDMGWKMLCNSHIIVQRDSQRIVIAGMENDGEGRFPQLGDVNKALWGISRDDFVVMLEHDPSSWHRKILPHSHTQLTLCGHTHGGQLKLFGWSPASIVYHEIEGLYQTGERSLFVTSGLGGVIPFRLFCPGEIVVITLHKK